MWILLAWGSPFENQCSSSFLAQALRWLFLHTFFKPLTCPFPLSAQDFSPSLTKVKQSEENLLRLQHCLSLTHHWHSYSLCFLAVSKDIIFGGLSWANLPHLCARPCSCCILRHEYICFSHLFYIVSLSSSLTHPHQHVSLLLIPPILKNQNLNQKAHHSVDLLFLLAITLTLLVFVTENLEGMVYTQSIQFPPNLS